MKIIMDSFRYILFDAYEKKVYTQRAISEARKESESYQEPKQTTLSLKDSIFAYYLKNHPIYRVYGFPSMDHEYILAAEDFRLVTGIDVSNEKFKRLTDSLSLKMLKVSTEKAPF